MKGARKREVSGAGGAELLPGIEERGTEFDLQHDRDREGGIGRKPKVSFQDPTPLPSAHPSSSV